VKEVVLLTGKYYYDVIQQRKQYNRTDMAFIRIEVSLFLSFFPISINFAIKSTDQLICQTNNQIDMGLWFGLKGIGTISI
jgi:2-oxoglutarate dehydrogenase complex dehydrogenase (E1) component-like enzyme